MKKVFELLGIKHKIHMSSESDYTATGNIDDMPELYELRETIRLPTYHIESTEFEDGAFVIPSYRSWGFMANAGDMFIETLTRHPRIVVFYSIGEPRRWIDDKLKFININQFYPELVSRGMDDVINAIGTLARGGIPKEYNDLFNAYMKDIKKIIKRKKKK